MIEASVWLQIGLYAGDAGTPDSNESGFDYDLGSTEGVMVIAETAVDATLLGRETTAKVGGYHHTGDFTDFDSGKSASGIYALYLILDQVLVGNRDQSRLAAFFRLGVSPLDDRSVVDWYLDAGMTAKGLRENDRVGLGFSHAHFGDAFDSAQDRAGTPVTDAESVIELTYRAPLTPWLALQPSLQYVIDPQDDAASDALVGGLRAEITF